MADDRNGSGTGFAPHDPPQVGNFLIEIDGVVGGYFSSCDGLEVEQEMVEYRFSEENFIRKRPGLVKYGDITLKGGWINGEMEDWIMSYRPGAGTAAGWGDPYQRKSVAIIMQDAKSPGGDMRRWNLYECHPKKWKINTLDTDGNGIVVQEIKFSIEYFEGE